ncbi:MAG: hypothetical protein RJA61_264 [Candidatus Parcubacteria bacterium]|jgi:tetratricopeptide (TPR) repeat protein
MWIFDTIVSMQKKLLLILSLGLVAFLFWYMYDDMMLFFGGNKEVIEAVEETTEVELALEESKLEDINLPRPDTTMPALPKDWIASHKEEFTENYNTIVSTLEEKPADFQAWLNLGLNLKVLGKYERAVEVWEYTHAIRPGSAVPPLNIALVEAYYLKNASKAETYFRKSLTISSSYVVTYFEFVAFYRDVVGDISKAKAIAEEGVRLNPKNMDLQDLYESLNK